MRPSFGDSLETAVDAIQQGTDGEIKDAIGDSGRARTKEVETLHRRARRAMDAKAIRSLTQRAESASPP